MLNNQQVQQRVLVNGLSNNESMQFFYQAAEGVFANQIPFQEKSRAVTLPGGSEMNMIIHDFNRPQAEPRNIDGILFICNSSDTQSIEKAIELINHGGMGTMGKDVKKMLVLAETNNQKGLPTSPENESLAGEIQKLESDKTVLVVNVTLEDEQSVKASISNLSQLINPQLSKTSSVSTQGMFAASSESQDGGAEKHRSCSIM